MSLDIFQAYVEGYGDRLLDSQIVALQSGYWSAYYAGAKHPKSPHKQAEDMMRRYQQARKKAKNIEAPKPDVDVEAFLEMEAQFQARLAQQGR